MAPTIGGGDGSWLNSFGRGLSPKPAYRNVNTDPDMKARYSKAPDVIRSVVELERAKHVNCATDEKPLRVDVERVIDVQKCFLDITCAGCYLEKRVEVDEKTGDTKITKNAINKSYAAKTLSERLADNTKASATERTKYPQIYMPKIAADTERIQKLRRWSASVEPLGIGPGQVLIIDDPDWEEDGQKRATKKPFITKGGKIAPKPNEKPPAAPLIDRLRIVRTRPAFDEEV